MKGYLVLNASKNKFQRLAITGGHFDIWAILDSSVFSYVIVITILLPTLLFFSSTQKLVTLFEKMPISVSGFFIIWAAFALESICLSVFQTTPGKKLLNIKLTPLNSNKFTTKLAFARSFKVLKQGLWFGLPGFYLIPIYINLMKLNKEGSMPWDRELNIMVLHKKVSIFKWLIYVVVMGSLLLFEVSIRILTNWFSFSFFWVCTPSKFIDFHEWGNHEMKSCPKWNQELND